MCRRIATVVALSLLAAGCADDSDVTATPEPPDPSPTTAPVPETSAEQPTTSAVTTPPDPSSTVAPASTDPVSRGEPQAAESYQSPEALLVPFDLSPDALDLFDGMLLSAYFDLVFEDGGRGGASPAVRVADGEAWILKGQLCHWDYVRALDAMDGSVLFDEGVLCAPGERYQVLRIAKALATARIEGRRIVLGAGENGLRHLDVDTREFEAVLDVDWDVERPAGASFGAGQWVVVMAESGVGEHEARGRIVFVDLSGSLVVHEHNPFPEFGDTVGPRGAALEPGGTTLIVAVEGEDGGTDLVSWDLETGTELSRHHLLDPFVPGDFPYPFGREFVSSLKVDDGRVLVNLTGVDGEYHASGALLVDPEGNVVDLSDQDEIDVAGADFLED